MILPLLPPQALPEERLCLPSAFADKIVDESPHPPEMAQIACYCYAQAARANKRSSLTVNQALN